MARPGYLSGVVLRKGCPVWGYYMTFLPVCVLATAWQSQEASDLDTSSCCGRYFRKFSPEEDSNRKPALSFHIPYYFFLDKYSTKLSRKQTKFKTRRLGERGLGGVG